jgi:hypothetical protein
VSRFQISDGILLCGAIIFAAFCIARLRASSLEEFAVFTFTAPVQVPGRVLPAGKYLFKLDQSEGELNVVKIENQDQSRSITGWSATDRRSFLSSARTDPRRRSIPGFIQGTLTATTSFIPSKRGRGEMS